MSLTKAALGYRLAETRMGDTIQDVAARELDDAGRWPELVAYNGLAPPYLVDDLAGVENGSEGGNVLLAGMHIRVPASKPRNDVSKPEDIFGTDILLTGGFLTADAGGDMATVSDLTNLRQALTIRLNTEQRELVWHRDYGNPLFKLKGQKAGPVNLQLGAAYGSRTLRSDPRITAIESITATIEGDSITVEATAVTEDGRPLPVRSTI